MKFFIASVLVLAPALAFARVDLTVQQVIVTRGNCLHSADSQAEMAACEEEAGLSAEAVLDAAYFKKIQQANSPAQKQALIKAERAWIAYRDADCKGYVGTSFDGGNGKALAIASCQNDRILERARALQAY